VGYVCGCHQQPLSQQHMGTAVRTAKTSPASWDAFSDIEAFVDEVLTELAAMAGTRPTRPGPKPPLTGAALRKAIMAIWCVGFCGVQWRAIGQLCDIPFSTLYTLFARWTRLWRRLLNRLILTWRQACGDKPVPRSWLLAHPCPSRMPAYSLPVTLSLGLSTDPLQDGISAAPGRMLCPQHILQ
jgi:hypothetical protein